jgi:hypothetical protein
MTPATPDPDLDERGDGVAGGRSMVGAVTVTRVGDDLTGESGSERPR